MSGLIRALVTVSTNDSGEVTGKTASGNVVGLSGSWGSGKSTVLNFVAERLRADDDVFVATFNPWIFSGRDELLDGFFLSLEDAFAKSGEDIAREIKTSLHEYWATIRALGDAGVLIASVFSVPLVGKIWSFIRNSAPALPEKRSLVEVRDRLELKLKTSKKAVVVLIDELDRVEDAEVRAVAQLVKAVGDIEGISYLVAYDADRVVDALGRGAGVERVKSGSLYLEKIIQYAVPVRPFFQNDAYRVLSEALKVHNTDDFDNESLQENSIFQSVIDAIQSPREVKRLVGTFSIIIEMVRGEIDSVDCLAYCWLLIKSPSVRDALAQNFDKLVDNPSDLDLLARVATERLESADGPTTIDDRISDALGEEALVHKKVLSLLFPVLGRARDAADFEGKRISRRQNLVRLLYLGNPPDLISAAEVRRVLEIQSESELIDELRNKLGKSDLGPFIDRMTDLTLDLENVTNPEFWMALSKTLTRQTDWATGPDLATEIARDAAEFLVAASRIDTNMRARVQKIFAELVRIGDLVLVPFVVRDLTSHYGLRKASTRQRTDVLLFPLPDFKQILEAELNRYKTQIRSGFVLKRIPTVQPFFAVGNVEEIGDDLMRSITDQLKVEDAIKTFACVLVPPGYSIGLSSLNELMLVDEVRQYLSERGDPAEWVADPWVRLCVKRLIAAINGEDLLFFREESEDQDEAGSPE